MNWERICPNSADSITPVHHRLVVVIDRGSERPLVVAGALTVDGNRRRSAVQVAVLGLGPPIVISELEGPVPGQGLELRTSGLWVDFVCEQPSRHWSYGLEAFALAVDDPTELLGRGFGARVPLGWELEFESDEEPQWLGPPIEDDEPPASGAARQLGLAHGLLLTGDGELPIEGRAVRSQSWGAAVLPVETVLAGVDTSDSGGGGSAGGDAVGDVSAAGGSGGGDAVGDVSAAGGSGGGDAVGGGDGDLAPVALPGLDDVWWVQGTAAGARTWHEPYESASSNRLS